MPSIRAIQRLRQWEIETNYSYVSEKVSVAQVNSEDVQIEALLGKGSFATVSKVRVFKGECSTHNDKQKRASTQLLDSNSFYACKYLSTIDDCDDESFLSGAIDLAMEIKLLQELDHKHIIKLRGIVSGPGDTFTDAFIPSNITNGKHRGFMLLMDVLQDTLQHRLDMWRRQEHSHFFSRFRHTFEQHYLEGVHHRLLTIGCPIVSAMEYLHSKRIILRDLKPANIGFHASDGSVQLFDFGLARPIGPDSDTCCPGELAGSLRYMAPEAIVGDGSSFATDVYSFGIVLWEICTLQRPYGHVRSISCFEKSIVQDKCRPSLQRIPTKALGALIESCWHPQATKRPSFAEISKIINNEAFCSHAKQRRSEMLQSQQPKSQPHLFRSKSRTAKSSTRRSSLAMI